jgi:hypothetical protein
MVEKIEYWECEICHSRYDEYDQAMECEEKGVTLAKRSVGDVVKIVPYYKELEDQEYVERRIVEICNCGHVEGYVLDKVVEVECNYYLGGHTPNWTYDDTYELLTDDLLKEYGY